ncbi:MAG: hypothetical protein H7X95_12220 [Deltaproteobacteria bacterium]|nr:hypothetical protein [Deltaproteobacteria bacterium]
MSFFTKKQDPKQHSAETETQDEALALDVEDGVITQGGDGDGGGSGFRRGYGIEDAIRLMRSLPTDQNIDLIVRVVRVTLGSVNVRIEDIIEDANRRQKAIQDNIAALHGSVADLEAELEARRREISEQEADFKETTSVKERLLLAEKSANMNAGYRAQNHAGASDLSQPPPPPPSSRALPKPSPRE